MDASTSPPPAFEQASAAYERLKQRRLRAAAAERRTRLILLSVAMVAFGGLAVGAVTYRDRLMQSLQAMTESKTSPSKGKSFGEWLPQSLRDSINNQRSDDERKFVETRTGQVRSFVGGNTCRDLQFNNDAGRFVAEALRQCETEGKADPSGIPQAKRLNAIRDAFQTR
jgi:hypothetical protein